MKCHFQFSLTTRQCIQAEGCLSALLPEAGHKGKLVLDKVLSSWSPGLQHILRHSCSQWVRVPPSPLTLPTRLSLQPLLRSVFKLFKLGRLYRIYTGRILAARATSKKTEPAVGVIYKKAEPTVRVTSKKAKPTVSAFYKKATPAVSSTSKKAMLMLVTPMWRLLWRAQSPGHHVLVRTMWTPPP